MKNLCCSDSSFLAQTVECGQQRNDRKTLYYCAADKGVYTEDGRQVGTGEFVENDGQRMLKINPLPEAQSETT